MGGLFGWLFGGTPFGLKEGQHALDALRQADIPEGQAATGQALNYDLALLNGDQAATEKALAPELNAASKGAETARRQVANTGTARGGGVNAEMQALTDVPTKTAVDTLTTLQPKAAAGVADIGSGLTNTGFGAAQAETGNALSQRGQNIGATADLLSAVSGGLGGGHPSPTPTLPSSPTDISGTFGGPTSVPTIDQPTTGTIPYQTDDDLRSLLEGAI